MKIISLKTTKNYDLDFHRSGENMMPCPECDHERRNKGKKSFSFNTTKGTGYCQNCEAKFMEYKPYVQKKEYAVPEWKNKTDLTDKALAWFAGRMISPATLARMKIYSDTQFMPQMRANSSVICFPYFFGDKLVNIKFRDGAKNFMLVKDAELILYNINCLEKATEVIITEGEIDCLSFIEVGYTNCISVPNGAGKNLEYLDNYMQLFDHIERIYIGADNDIKGMELKSELIKRFGQERCSIVHFKDCKDSNEYLIKYGGIALSETILNAKEIQIEGIIDVDTMYDDTYSLYLTGAEKGKTIGLPVIDNIVSWETGRVAVVTGIPSHGKSEIVDFLVTLLNILYGWKVAFFSPENFPIKYHIAKLVSKITGKQFKSGYLSDDEFTRAYDYLKRNFYFIYPEEDMTFDNILSKAKVLVKKHGITTLVFDPFNKIEHLLSNGESETMYISRFLDKASMFAKKHNVLVIIVAHPTKMKKKLDGTFEVPTLYDINASANWFNKCDYGLSVYRDYNLNTTTLFALKVKFKNLGSGGEAKLRYNYNNGRYEDAVLTIDHWNNKSYIELHQPVIQTYNPSMTGNSNYDTSDKYLEAFNNEPPF
jgi:twinkle protein